MKLTRRNHFTFDHNFVTIHSSNNDRPRYPIQKKGIDERDSNNCSVWIMYLTEKNWIEKQDLYELAAMIAKEYPDTSIDWPKTFFFVESKNQSDDEGTPLSRTEIEQIVNKRLKHYNLINISYSYSNN